MTVEQIRDKDIGPDASRHPSAAQAFWLREIAAQLAEMNERQRLTPLGTAEEPIFLREAKQ